MFADFRPINMLMESAVGAVRGDIRVQTGGGFQPVVDIMAGLAAALLIEVIGVIADIVLGGFGDRRGRAGCGWIVHGCCCFRHKESGAHV